MLYLEKHNLHLTAFPTGNFSHKTLSVKEAKKMIERAIDTDGFHGIFTHDNSNPERADKSFDQFLKAMDEHCNIHIPVNKFFNEEILEDGETLTFGNPACLITLQKGDVLMVVDYCFSMPENTEGKTGLDRLLNMSISPDTIKFHVFEMIDIDI